MADKYTYKQGQYLSFIYYYTKLNGCPPAEADMQKYFKTTLPAVHGMVVQLEKKGFIEKKPMHLAASGSCCQGRKFLTWSRHMRVWFLPRNA